MRTGRTILATVVLVSGLMAGAWQTPVAARHVANVTGGRESVTLVGSGQLANVTGGREGATSTSPSTTA
jgi:hypothetical protein